jgi:hypothetical protein
MATFDMTTDDQVGIIDFSKYVNIRALLAASKWPAPPLVSQADIARALADAKLLAGGEAPDPDELGKAPLLRRWRIIDNTKRGQGLRLIGVCSDHPILQGKRILTTSHIVAMDLDKFRWARTLSRYYRLGQE